MYKRQLERLNGTSFVSVAKKTTTAQIQCGSRRSVQQLHGTQIGRLAHSCSIAAGHSAMAASADNPPSSSFQIRAIPKSLTDKLEDWGHNQDLAAIIKRIGNRGHLQQLKAQVSNLTASSVDREDLQQSTHIAVLAAIIPLICLILIGAGSFTLWLSLIHI